MLPQRPDHIVIPPSPRLGEVEVFDSLIRLPRVVGEIRQQENRRRAVAGGGDLLQIGNQTCSRSGPSIPAKSYRPISRARISRERVAKVLFGFLIKPRASSALARSTAISMLFGATCRASWNLAIGILKPLVMRQIFAILHQLAQTGRLDALPNRPDFQRRRRQPTSGGCAMTGVLPGFRSGAVGLDGFA